MARLPFALADILQTRMSRKHNNRQVSATGELCNWHIRRNTNKNRLALSLLFQIHIPGI